MDSCEKTGPLYYRRADRLLVDTGRYRELTSRRKDFKKQWRELETKETSFPINDAYRPNLNEWKCTCPSLSISRFLIYSHLVQMVRRVPPVFFLEAKRARTIPFCLSLRSHPTNCRVNRPYDLFLPLRATLSSRPFFFDHRALAVSHRGNDSRQ
jgi:hypothetical protein